jgi:hypothetical protein
MVTKYIQLYFSEDVVLKKFAYLSNKAK